MDISISTAIPPKPFPISTPSKARAELAAHHQNVAAERARHAEAWKPAHELRDRRDGALAELRSAELQLAGFLAAEAAAVLDNNGAADFSDSIAAASTVVEKNRRVVAALESKLAEAEKIARDVELSLSISDSARESLIAGVVSEIADEALADLAQKQKAAAQAEAAVRTLAATIKQKRWLPLLERLNTKLNATPAPFWGEQPHPPWPEFLSALESNAHAEIPAVQS